MLRRGMHRYMKKFTLVIGLFGSSSFAADYILESAREIPVAHEVDVVVVGGTVGAVAAAVEAASQGAKVFLAAPRPYLGEDVAGTLNLWLEAGEEIDSVLGRAIFDRAAEPDAYANRLSFTYTADRKANPKHPDPKRNMLNNGKWNSAVTESVQYDGDVNLIADIGRMARIKHLHVLAFYREGDFEVGDIQVWTSPNGKRWRDLGNIDNVEISPGHDDREITASMEINEASRYVKILVEQKPGTERVLIGEIVITEDGLADSAVTLSKPLLQPPTPMQVKVALDRALLDAGVTFLYGCPVTDVITDQAGNAAGVVIANRNGRQAVTGKVIIDATERAVIAEMAGAAFTEFPSGEYTATRVVVGGEPKGDVRDVGVGFNAREGRQKIYQHTLKLPMKDGSWHAYVEAEHLARNRTFDVAVADEADAIFMMPPDRLLARGKRWDDLSALQPEGVRYVMVLGPRCGVPRDNVATFLRPLTQIKVGTSVGAAAVALTRGVRDDRELMVASMIRSGRSGGDIKEFLGGPRPTMKAEKHIPSPARGLPILGKYDVVVVGGGTGGAPAAIGAARKGAKTLLIEYQDHLGGVGTLGLIANYWFGYRKGFTAEVDEGVKAMGGPKRKGGWNPVAKREWWRREVRKAGGEIWFSTLGAGAVVKNGTVNGVVVVTPHGRGVVLARSVVDSTGNSDIAVVAGAGYITTSAEHVAMQGTGLSPKSLGAGYTNTDYSFSDESDPVDQWRMIVSARQKYQNDYDLSTFIDSRERRRIDGEYFVTPLDIINDKKYADTVSLHSSNFDTHGYTVHPIFLIHFPDKKGMTARVPYRSMVPKGVDGVLVTGLGMCAHRDSMPILRMQACIQNQGYAAGWASAEAAVQNVAVRDIRIRKLQEHLVSIGSLPKDDLGTPDSSLPGLDRIEAAVADVVKEYNGLAVLLQQPDKALPLLRKAYAATEPSDRKLIYANILGMMGDPGGASVLAETVKNQEWDQGWNFKGMGQFGGSISRLDSHIIALGRSGDPEGLSVILGKVATLDASKEFSHHRAVAIALEERGPDPKAAQALAKLLQKEGMTGFAITEVTPETPPTLQEQRSQPLREIILARALYRCGDVDGLGEKILRTYESDLRGLFARHAQAVLREQGEPVRLEIGL